MARSVRLLTRSLTAPDSRLRHAVGALQKRSGWLPTALLALALAGVFALNSDREHFYAHVEWDSAKNMAIAENLSAQHNFRLFLRLIPPPQGEDAELQYEPYGRFPIGSFALIKLLILPLGDNIGAAVFAGRLLMLASFSAAALLAYHAIARIASNKWIALTATLIAFSSYQVLWFADHISNEMMIGLFGFMLIFHGMTVFVQEGRFRQLLLKACVALLFDWHVYALLAPFVIYGLGKELVAAVRARRESPDQERAAPSAAGAILAVLVRSRYSRLAAATLLLGVALLTSNIANEYDALNGKTPLIELPSMRSMVSNMSLPFNETFPGAFPWMDHLVGQSYRIAAASIPFTLMETEWLFAEIPPNTPPLSLVAAGALAVASLAGLLFVRRYRILFAALALSGFCWSLLMRSHVHSSFHAYEGIYWVGVPLTLVTLLLLAAGRFRVSRILIPSAAALALLGFSLSAYEMMTKGPSLQREADKYQALFSDFENIRKTTHGKSVVVAQTLAERWGLYGAITLNYFLAGSHTRHFYEGLPAEYDFVLIPHHRDASAPLLTPENEIVFLYGPVDPEALRRARFDSILSSIPEEPAAQSVYDVYRYDVHQGEGSLVYVKEPCRDADFDLNFNDRVFLHIFPENAADLPEYRKRHGYDSLLFNFAAWSVQIDGKCAAEFPLPDYSIRGIRTGEWALGLELWDAAFSFETEAYIAAYDAAAPRRQDARAEFNMRIDKDERAITYTREPCTAQDIARPFFLHVFPDRPDDLPEERRDIGFESLDFDFRLNGAVFDGKCAAKVSLPGYPIAGVRTGQWIRGEDEIWSAAFPFDAQAHAAAYESAASRQPDARAEFNVYLDEGERALTYTREPCAAPDIAHPFFLHVVPEREDDLRRQRREFGFDNLDFDFRLRGAMFNGKCAAQVPLPDYRIAAIRTGQWIRGEGKAWEAEIQPPR